MNEKKQEMKDYFCDIGYVVKSKTEDGTVYSKYLGDTEFTLVFDKNKMKITKYANDFRRKVEIKPDAMDIKALKLSKENP